MKTLILLFAALLAISCRQSADTREEEERRADSIALADSLREVESRTVIDETPDKNAYAEFTTTDGKVNLRLRSTRNEVSLSALGTPTDTLRRVLNIATDPHQGAVVTEYKYENVNLVFFQPKGSNEGFLRTVEIKGGPWTTARGIKVGDSVADLKNMYPNIADWKDEPEVYQYVYNIDDSVLLFGIENDKVSRIKIEYNIP